MMEGIYHEQPLLDGWANNGAYFDHAQLGFDQAPYRSLYVPAELPGHYPQGLHHPLPQEGLGLGLSDPPDEGLIPDDGLSSEDEEDEEEDGLELYGHVDLHKTLGQQMAVWCHRSPDTLAIFTPIPGDTLATAVSFARTTLQFDPAVDRALLLLPGQSRPADPATLHAAKPGSSILLVPKYDYVVSLEVSQLDLKLQMMVKVTMTVRSLKAALQRDRGFPVDRTELLFRDQPMENQRHLFDYRVTHGVTIFVMLHLVYDVRVMVETFWGQNYEIYVDPCMTAAGLLNIVLRRTISPQAGEVASYFHLTLPRHALVMYSSQGTPMKWTGSLGLYGVDEGSVLSLSTVALAHQMSVQTVPLVMEGRNAHSFLVSKFDYWSVLALKVHGLLGYPINLMRLMQGNRELDLARAVGSYSHKSAPVRLDLSLLRTDNDVCNGVTLSFRLGNGMEETLKCSPTRTVKSVKSMLEEIGVPNATAYDFFVDGYRLPHSGRIVDVVEEYKKPIDLKLRQYPVFVHAPKSVIYKMSAYAQEALKVFKARVEMKTGLSHSDYYMLMSGMPVTDSDSSQVFRTPLAIGASVFLMSLQHHQTLFIVWDDWLVKLRLPFHPQPSEIKEVLWKDRNIPEGSLSSVANFMQWYFAMKANTKGLLLDPIAEERQRGRDMRQRKSRPRRRRDQGEAALWKYNNKQMRQLQTALEQRHQHQHQHQHQQRPPQAKLPPISTRKKAKPGVTYAAHRSGRWQRVNPEDLVDSYLRAWSLPPDRGHKMQQTDHYSRRRKHHSAMPDLNRKQGQGQSRRTEPQWVHSLQQIARREKVEPAHTGLTKRKPRKKQIVLKT